MLRKMSVNGSFYPNNPKQIKILFEKFNSLSTTKREIDKDIVASIVPHAGYIYSGFTANEVYKLFPHKKRVIVIGPSHRYAYLGISGSFFDNFETPLGNLEIDLNYLDTLKKFKIEFFPIAHQEHSTEVQMPFIKYYLGKIKVVELIYSQITYQEMTPLIEYIMSDKDNLLLISSDLSHFYNFQKAKELDSICIKGIKDRDIKVLERGCEACGIIGLKALIQASIRLNLKTKIINYTTSADTSGDKSSVVGYVSAIVS